MERVGMKAGRWAPSRLLVAYASVLGAVGVWAGTCVGMQHGHGCGCMNACGAGGAASFCSSHTHASCGHV